MTNQFAARRRSRVARLLRFSWRCLRILVVVFAAIGPAPPPPPLPRHPLVEMRAETGAKPARRK